MPRTALALCLITLLAACDERRQPTNPPGTQVGTGTQTSTDGAPPPPPQGGIPAGQADPQKPTAGDSLQPPRQ